MRVGHAQVFQAIGLSLKILNFLDLVQLAEQPTKLMPSSGADR